MAKVTVLLTLVALFTSSKALQCWDCSSDLDPRCGDMFNGTEILNRRGGGVYDSFQQNYNQQQNYNNNNNNQQQNYNNQPYNSQQSGYNNGQTGYNNGQTGYNNGQSAYNNQNYNQQSTYNPNTRNYQQFNQQSQQYPRLQTCNNDDVRYSRMKHVCIKKVTRRGNNELFVSRRCEKVPHDAKVGTCYDPVSRGITLEFCEYCEYDGCNSAHQTSTTKALLFVTLVPLVLFAFNRV